MKLSVSNTRAFKAVGDKQFELIKECGFDACDFMLDNIYVKSENKLREYCADIKARADAAGIEIGQTHADFCEQSSDFASGWKNALARTITSIRATGYLGTKYCVVHPIRLPGRYDDKLVEENYAAALEFYKKLTPYLEEYDVICCLENMWNRDPIFNRICGTILSRSEELIRMCDELGDRFAICVDNGHAELTQDPSHQMIRDCGSRVKVLHLHQTDGVSDLHTIPYSIFRDPPGTKPLHTDWEEVIKALKEIGYDGNLNFEVLFKSLPDPLVPAGHRYLAKMGRYFMALYNGEIGEE